MFHLVLQHADDLKELHGSPHLLLLLVVAISASDLLEVLPALVHQDFFKQPYRHLLLPLLYLFRRLLYRVFGYHVRARKKKFLAVQELLDLLFSIGDHQIIGGGRGLLSGFSGDTAIEHAQFGSFGDLRVLDCQWLVFLVLRCHHIDRVDEGRGRGRLPESVWVE